MRKPYIRKTDLSVSDLDDSQELSKIVELVNSDDMKDRAFHSLILLKSITKNDTELNALALCITEMKTGRITRQHDGMPYSEIPDLEI